MFGYRPHVTNSETDKLKGPGSDKGNSKANGRSANSTAKIAPAPATMSTTAVTNGNRVHCNSKSLSNRFDIVIWSGDFNYRIDGLWPHA